MLPTDAFVRARDFLLDHRDDYEAAYAGFRWPDLPEALGWARPHAGASHRGRP
jgi:acetyl-CoA synthetase